MAIHGGGHEAFGLKKMYDELVLRVFNIIGFAILFQSCNPQRPEKDLLQKNTISSMQIFKKASHLFTKVLQGKKYIQIIY